VSANEHAKLVANPPVKLENVPFQDLGFKWRRIWLVDSACLLSAVE
jgi:hypothetical protein